MPETDIEKAKDTREEIKRGDYSNFLFMKDTEDARVRPKATTQSPYMETPQDTLEKKNVSG